VNPLTCFEVCAGGGGQALGLERAGFLPSALVELNGKAVATLRANRPGWPVSHQCLTSVDGVSYGDAIDLLAAGVPCPPFSVAGQQLGSGDSRDLFPALLQLAEALRPRAILIENVPGLAGARFASYLSAIRARIERTLNLTTLATVLRAADFGLAQLRPRFVLVALPHHAIPHFAWPEGSGTHIGVGETLLDLMSANGWPFAHEWSAFASRVGPTIVGGSRRHGGPDLGPSRSRASWRTLGIDGRGLALEPPSRWNPHFMEGAGVRLTLRMVARLQGFPDDWKFQGGKTEAYRQIGNAFPPPVAHAVGAAIRDALVACAEGKADSETGFRPLRSAEPADLLAS
jgi:DNA (cytosine-5)-methyltransferase 1